MKLTVASRRPSEIFPDPYTDRLLVLRRQLGLWCSSAPSVSHPLDFLRLNGLGDYQMGNGRTEVP